MPNIETDLILVKGKDKTSSITSWKYDSYKPVVYITFNNGKSYPYNIADVQFMKKNKTVYLNTQIALKNGSPLFGVKVLLYFEQYCRIIYLNGYAELQKASCIQIVNSALDTPKSKNCFEYLKQIAIRAGLHTEDGNNILATRYEKIGFIRDDSILSDFLCGSLKSTPQTQSQLPIIYPFGTNLSQKQAVEHALEHRLSVIEGPPGTGKTQTILNIIANAMLRGETVAVVSGNNSATANVYEKLKKHHIEFIAAPLGNSFNKNDFIENQTGKLPNMSGWKQNTSELISKLNILSQELNEKLALKNQLSINLSKIDTLEKEYTHFGDYYKSIADRENISIFHKSVNADKILDFIAEYEILLDNKVYPGWIKKLIWRFRYGIRNLKKFEHQPDIVVAYSQTRYYVQKLAELRSSVQTIQKELSDYHFDDKIKEYADLSMQILKSMLAQKYQLSIFRPKYTADDLWKHSSDFINDYPVILSTTYSVRTSLSNQLIYDYVIVDEASQVDLVTGTLALSCAKKAVIVGDLKQLPNVVNQEQKELTNSIFQQYGLPEAYRYSTHSLLSSIVELFPKLPHVLLKEHYRCHPEIIGFCNQRFYNNELIIMTHATHDCQALTVYKTVPGNHARGHVNQRQIDVITDEVFPKQHLNANDGSVGIVTPYRVQADQLQKAFQGTAVKADTADKFQGQERNIIIFSTVDNEIGEFASDPNRLNVAVSRAKDQFIVVTDGNENDQTSPIHELIGYIQYHNHQIINSEIHSVFDYLYKDYACARERVLQKYGRISNIESENLMYQIIREVLRSDEFTKFDVVSHVPLKMILCDMKKLNTRELSFATNRLTHVDFLIYSSLTHQPILVIEVDGYAYHNANEKQTERDCVKDAILEKYNIPILRMNTTGSNEKSKLENALKELK